MSDIKKLKEAYAEVVSGKVEVNEGTLMREYERGEFRKGDEKRFVALIKKNGGKKVSHGAIYRENQMFVVLCLVRQRNFLQG